MQFLITIDEGGAYAGSIGVARLTNASRLSTQTSQIILYGPPEQALVNVFDAIARGVLEAQGRPVEPFNSVPLEDLLEAIARPTSDATGVR